MKKAFLLTLLSLVITSLAFADDDGHQSYLSYDDGGTIVKSGDDGREIEAHRNLPIYSGDEIITARRGRSEVRLSDGNVVGIDRTTALRFRSILNSYEGDDRDTVAELRYGKVAVHRTDIGRDNVRLDTENASYIAEREAVYSVETDAHGRDRVTVFAGSIEVRTPARTTRLRSGETATIDDRGVYDLVGDQRDSADDFERWFLRRADRLDRYDNRYVDRRLGYWADDLDDHGRWVHVAGIGWSWRPYVSASWRPYHNGYWHHGRGGALVWVS
ncbi:MAG TPA: FecR domain-containing protein, partial [Thermoanaerobaculia bacterium]|nr:FecR domain-containing protein [Thermoanaerobaculia bacterium]